MMIFKRESKKTRRFALRFMLAISFCLLSAISSVQAQVITASISGTVQDSTGAVIKSATVMLLNQNTSDARKTVSNDRGYFTFAGAIPGTYTVKIEAKGFKGWQQADLALNASDSRSLAGIRLEVGAATESVVVESASMELLPTDNGERSSLLTSNDIERLTVTSRELSELLKILPGVTTVSNGTNNNTTSLTTMSAAGSDVGNGLSPNGAPYRGGSAYILDGANIIDVGANSSSIASVNPDMTAEVKVQTSNFGADSEDGPVIINVISKSGGSSYHGQAYLYTRNGVLNSNSWTNNHTSTAKTSDKYYYPGGNFGGPVRFPHSDFNKNNKLLFWGGYEYQWQDPGAIATLNVYVPGADMKAGNFTLNNTNDTSSFDSNAKLCPSGFNTPATGTWCSSPSIDGYDTSKNIVPGYDASGNVVPVAPNGGGAVVTPDPGAVAMMKLWPTANIDPDKNSGYNYHSIVGGQQNVYIYRFRADYNLNENNKFFATYQQGHNDSLIPVAPWWAPGNAPLYAGGGIDAPTTSRVLTGNLLTVITPTLTNEFVGAWSYADESFTPKNATANYSTTLGYTYGTPFNSSLAAPIYTVWSSVVAPNMYLPDIWESTGSKGKYPMKKSNASFSDNVTKVYKTHTIKAGVFTELVNNNQGGWVDLNGKFGTTTSSMADPLNSNAKIGGSNPTANLVMGIAGSFDQANIEAPTDEAFRTTAAYVMDDWKVFPRLMINLGWRFDHIGRWYDRQNNGMAVWLPNLYASDVAGNTAWPFPGVRWHGVNPGILNSGSPIRTAFTEPRLGLSYDLFGTGKTVLRGGWGEYRWNDQSGDYAGPLTSAANSYTYTTPSGNVTMKEVGALGNGAGTFSTSAASSVNVVDPNDNETGATYAYNFTISQQTPWHTLLEVAYVGNNTKNLLMGGESGASHIAGTSGYVNKNKIPIGGLFKSDPVTGAAAPVDPDNTGSYNLTDYFPYYKGYGQNAITMYTHNGYSNYNGLQIAWVKQTGKFTYNVNYTWSKSLGIVGSAVDGFTVRGNYGVLNIDRPYVINTSYAYSMGRILNTSNKILSGAANRWNISGTTTWQAGGNLQTNEGQNFGLSITDTSKGESLSTKSYYGTNVGEILVTDTCSPKSHLASHQELNVLCLTPPALGVYGKRQIGYLGGPAYFNSDLTIYKEFHVIGKQTVQFRAAMFNFLNHPLWQFTTTKTITPTFNTTDRVNFTSTLLSNLSTGLTQGTPDQKQGYRLGELSVKYNF